MILYHGSNIVVDKPDLKYSRKNLDFGMGFYTTTIEDQAKKWSERFVAKDLPGIISIYEIDDEKINNSNTLSFETYSDEWLDFIVDCRSGKDTLDYDVIIGGIANDKVFNTCELYLKKMITKSQALRRLRYEKPNLQVCLKNQEYIDKNLIYKDYIKLWMQNL